MLSKKRQQDYFVDRMESVIHNYEMFSKHTRAENIHKIRVELKKIRALVFVQEKTGSLPNAKALTYIHKLFKQAGKIRDAQVSAALMKKMKTGTPEFFTHQREIVAKESKVFNTMVSRHVDDLVKACSRQWKSFRDIPAKEITKLNKSIVKKLKPVFIPRIKVTELHESRKAIKRLVYLNSFLKEKDGSRMNTDHFRKLEEVIGLWHDALVTEKLVKKFSSVATASRLLTAQKQKFQKQILLNARKCF